MITKDVLSNCAKQQQAIVETGDIMIIRTGWLRWYLEEATAEQKQELAGDPMTNLRFPGIGPDEEMASYLWDLHVAPSPLTTPRSKRGRPGRRAAASCTSA